MIGHVWTVGHAYSPIWMRILFAGIIARYPLRRRHLVFPDVPARAARTGPRGVLCRGHRRVRLRPDPEHRRHRPVVRHGLHSRRARSVRTGRSLDVRELRRQLPWPQRRRRPALRGRRRPLHQSFGRILVLARRVRTHPAQDLHRLGSRRSPSSPSRRRSRGTSSSSSGSITCSPSARTSAPPRRAIPTGAFTWHKTWQPVTLDDWKTIDATGRPLYERDDVAD